MVLQNPKGSGPRDGGPGSWVLILNTPPLQLRGAGGLTAASLIIELYLFICRLYLAPMELCASQNQGHYPIAIVKYQCR
jgi:hypothetical protein